MKAPTLSRSVINAHGPQHATATSAAATAKPGTAPAVAPARPSAPPVVPNTTNLRSQDAPLSQPLSAPRARVPRSRSTPNGAPPRNGDVAALRARFAQENPDVKVPSVFDGDSFDLSPPPGPAGKEGSWDAIRQELNLFGRRDPQQEPAEPASAPPRHAGQRQPEPSVHAPGPQAPTQAAPAEAPEPPPPDGQVFNIDFDIPEGSDLHARLLALNTKYAAPTAPRAAQAKDAATNGAPERQRAAGAGQAPRPTPAGGSQGPDSAPKARGLAHWLKRWKPSGR